MFRCFLNQYRIPAVLLIWVILIQFFCNIDSYLYAQIGQFDSACFFMCGKAMMNGMIPYTDFADSKGVLLWLIYGLGYLYDHYSYVGVFWLACINVWLTLMISYRTARLWLDETPSLLSAMLLMAPLMYWNFYTETKAEHFCWPAVAWGIYAMMNILRGGSITKSHGLWLGVGVIACLMLKWSVALMMVSIVCSIGWLCMQRRTLSTYLIPLGLGLVVASLPLAIYFTIVDNWMDFWQEYFANTFASVSIPLSETICVYSLEWWNMFTSKRFLYLLYTLPVLLLVWNKKEWFATALPSLCGLFFIALSIRHDQFGHYISVVGPFAILTIVFVVKYWQYWHLRLRYLAAFGTLAMVYIIWGTIHYTDCFCTKAGAKFDQYMAVSAAMSQVKDPKIIIIGQERGVCMGTALPGTRYWITQMGRTEEMWRSQVAGIESKDADFVIYYGMDPNIDTWLESVGYRFWKEYNCKIFTKYCLLDVEDVRSLSPYDIIFKRTYAEVYGICP